MKKDITIYSLVGAIRFWRGTIVNAPRAQQPAKLLQLYDIEACPYCRLVREQLTELDLDVLIKPCPKKGSRFRAEAQQIGGKQQFPFLVDDNTGTRLYGSADIIRYLHKTYGSPAHGARMVYWVASRTSEFATAIMLAVLGLAGMRARPSKAAPAQPLELFSFEASPYAKPVRARLCELELPYKLHNTGKGGLKEIGRATFGGGDLSAEHGSTPNREWLATHTGKIQIPYLIDDNTRTAMFESTDIVNYLDRTYAAA